MQPSNPKVVVLYHANCADGMCAAWVAKGRLPADTEFIPAFYGMEPPDVTGKRVYLLDFSFKAVQLRRMIEQADTLTVLDHHKTAEAELEKAWPNMMLGSKYYYVFDNAKSGARLAWEQFYGTCDVPRIVAYVEDRDLWAKKLPFTEEISAYVRSYPFTFEAYDEISDQLDGNGYLTVNHPVVQGGQAILKYEQTTRDRLIANAIEVDVQGHKIKMVNAPILQSEIGEKLALESGTMGLMFWVRADGVTEFGLRSRSDFDVSVVAKRLGGGGHAQAAGFQHRLPLPFVPTTPGNADQGRFVDILAANVLQMQPGASEPYMANLQMANAWLHDKVRDKMKDIIDGVKNGPAAA